MQLSEVGVVEEVENEQGKAEGEGGEKGALNVGSGALEVGFHF